MKISTACLVFLLLTSGAALAQPAAQGEAAAPPLAPAEIQNLMDGYAIGQAQTSLGLSDTEFTPFLAKFRALQNLRRRNEQERMRLLNELRRLSNPSAQAQDSEIQTRLRALRELVTRAMAHTQSAYDSIDQPLDLRQQE